MEIWIIVSIAAVTISLITLILNRRDKAVQNTKENHQELIEYQVKELKEDLKNIASDVKDVKKILDSSKESFRSMIKNAIDEHVKLYHSRGK